MEHETQNMKHESAFTLIEAIVAASVFALVVSSILGIYVSVLHLDTRTRAQRTLADNSRFIMDFFGKEIDNGHIDYASYPNNVICKNGTAMPCDISGNDAPGTTELYIVNQAGDAEHFYLYNENTKSIEHTYSNCQTVNCDLVLTKNSGTASNLNSSDVRVTNLQFYTSPTSDPFSSAKNFSYQPQVTAVLELTANTGKRDQIKINLQSTFSELYYPSR
ncbi:MAG TPA: prepilin-type N-terminal cleavage/methylation domain-containing protein [Patescibacteria group bacterium]|nr:prepilin-type N-terminal cleavage/methylation domain-containing protein [Patescibacteria group bacterium]